MTAAAPPRSIADEVIHSWLADGRDICIRTVRPSDEARMRNGIEQLSSRSRYMRFFSGQPMPSEPVLHRLLDVDGHRHIAWGAILTGSPDHPAIGAVHAIRADAHNGTGEFSVAIVDAFHGLGLARMLTAVLLINCRLEKIAALEVQILTENRAAGNLVRSLGGQRCTTASGVSEYLLDTDDALGSLQAQTDHRGVQQIFRQLAAYL
jgi:RimJ/RimL family protein N-acetyltransferase